VDEDIRMKEMILVTGESLIDMLVANGEADTFHAVPGGSPFNVAMALGRLGAPVSFMGRFSYDHFGQLLHKTLEESGVDLSFSSRVDSLSTIGFVTQQSESAGPDYSFYTKGTAGCELSMKDFSNPLPDYVKVVHIGSFSLAIEPFASALEDLIFEQSHEGRLVTIDINIRPFLIEDRDSFCARVERFTKVAHLIKLSDEDLNWLYPGMSPSEACQHYLEHGAGLVVVTRGDQGVCAANRRGLVEVEAPVVPIEDTVGAGDTFQASMVASLFEVGCFSRESLTLLTGESIRSILERAANATAMNCRRRGCQPPTREELNAFEKGG
jgi:fructokinase